LDVLGNGLIERLRSTTSSSAYLRFDGTGTSFPYVGLLGGIGTFGNTDASPIRFNTNNAERMRIDSSGNVGIGTSSPDGKLNVQRTAASAGWIINGQTVGVANDSGLYVDASNNIELAVRDGSGTFTGAVRSSGSTFFNGGDVGIGTSSPSQLLTVSGGNIALVGGGNMFSAATSSSYSIAGGNTFNNGGSIRFGGSTSGAVAGGLIFNSGAGATNSERMRITSAGNVGIGTSSPSNVLTVSSATQYKGFTLTNGTNTVAELLGFAAGNDSGGLKLHSGGVAKAQVLAGGTSFFNGGNVGIGTSSPSRTLHISASDCRIRLTDSDAAAISVELMNSNGSGILATNGASDLLFQTDNAERMRITSSGNVTTTGDMFIDRDGQTSAAWLNIDATNGYQTGVRLLTAGVKRWEIGTHEASALEDFVLRSYNDAGGGVIETMYITRSTSQVAFAGNVVGTNAAGPALLNETASSTNPTLVPNKANLGDGIGAATAGNLHLITNGGNRVAIGGDGVVNILTAGSFGTPALSFNSDYDTGIYHSAADTLAFATGGGGRLTINTSTVTSGLTIDVTTASGPALLNEAASSANPTLVPNKASPSFGVGGGTNEVALIGNGSEVLTVGANTLGFFGSAPIVKRTVTGSRGGNAALASLLTALAATGFLTDSTTA
jgi:hypothetical protein